MDITLHVKEDFDPTYIGYLTDVAFALEKGICFEQDYDATLALNKIAAYAGDENALNNLGWMIHNGFGTAADIPKAMTLYEKLQSWALPELWSILVISMSSGHLKPVLIIKRLLNGIRKQQS